MKTGLIAAMVTLSAAWVVGGLASEQQLGSAVDAAVSATIYGGCSNEFSLNCEAAGTCVSTGVVLYTGDGDWEQKTTVNCGGVGSCVLHSKTSKKCGS